MSVEGVQGETQKEKIKKRNMKEKMSERQSESVFILLATGQHVSHGISFSQHPSEPI